MFYDKFCTKEFFSMYFLGIYMKKDKLKQVIINIKNNQCNYLWIKVKNRLKAFKI